MKSFRLLLLALGGIVVVGVAALIVAFAALDPNKLRATLVDSVHRATGRDLTVTGPVHLRLGLSPRFEVDDIAFANPAGASRPQMLTAKSLTAELALLPLLGGDAVISSLTLQDADIALERGADGTGNWQFVPVRHALFPAQAGTGSGEGGGASHHVEIRSIRLEGGRLTWQTPQAAPQVFAITHLRWSSAGPDLPMLLAFEGSKDDVPLTLTADSGSLQRLQGGPVSALAGAWPLTVDAAALGATVHLEGGISHPDQARGFQFRLTATAHTLDGLEKLAGVAKLPPLADVTATALLSDGPAGELRTSQVSVHAGASDLGTWATGLAIKQLQFSAPGPGQLAQLNVDGTYQDQPLRLAGTATQPDVVGTGGPVQATITAQAAGANLSAHGTMPPSLGASGLDMTVSLRAPDVAALSPLIGRALPAAHDFALDAQVGDAGVKLRGVAIRDLVIASSIGDATGELTVQWAPRAAITGSLTSNVLDLDAITAPAGGVLPAVWPLPGTSGGGGEVVAMPQVPPTPSTGAPPATPAPPAQPPLLPLARLRTTDADVALAVANLTVAGQHLQDLQAHFQLADGKLAPQPIPRPVAGWRHHRRHLARCELERSADRRHAAVTFNFCRGGGGSSRLSWRHHRNHADRCAAQRCGSDVACAQSHTGRPSWPRNGERPGRRRADPGPDRHRAGYRWRAEFRRWHQPGPLPCLAHGFHKRFGPHPRLGRGHLQTDHRWRRRGQSAGSDRGSASAPAHSPWPYGSRRSGLVAWTFRSDDRGPGSRVGGRPGWHVDRRCSRRPIRLRIEACSGPGGPDRPDAANRSAGGPAVVIRKPKDLLQGLFH